MNDLADAASGADVAPTLVRLGIAAALGLLVGLQRERAASRLAGIRTFPLITIWGTLSGLLAAVHGGWVLAAGAIALASVMAVENLASSPQRRRRSGTTTEVAALVMFGAGAHLAFGPPVVAVVLAGAIAFLLQQKRPLHRMTARIGDADFRAIMRFVLISLVVLPVLPDRSFGPWDTLNPFRTWLMVVLIVGLGLGGYVAFKLLGSSAGVALGGVLGGLVSSTATTVSYARRSRSDDAGARFAQLVITIASTVAFARILVEVAAVAPALLPAMGPPLALVVAAMALVCAGLYATVGGGKVALPEAENPAALAPALAFGAVYAIVTLASAAAERFLGPSALYAVALVSGLTDVDAITLSTASLANRGAIAPALAWRVILTAALANLAFKLAIVCVLGPRLAPRIAVSFGAAAAVGVALIALWPDGAVGVS
jgi:uncharacterized membrane protein (DUF4010 family)